MQVSESMSVKSDSYTVPDMFESSSITYIIKISCTYVYSAGRVLMACVVEIGSRSVLSKNRLHTGP